MLVKSMSNEEVVAEVRKDWPYLYTYTYKMGERYVKKLKRARLSKVDTVLEHKSPRRNKWFISVLVDVPHWTKVESVTFGWHCNFNSIFGYRSVCFAVSDNHVEVVIHSGHFFDRLKERGKLVGERREIIQNYFRWGTDNILTDITGVDENGICDVVRNNKLGLEFGYRNVEKKFSIFNTFVSEDMLRNDQKELKSRLEFDKDNWAYKDKLRGNVKIKDIWDSFIKNNRNGI